MTRQIKIHVNTEQSVIIQKNMLRVDIYMSKDNAHKLCGLLNNGLVKLTCRD